jgi:hypothetical protein
VDTIFNRRLPLKARNCVVSRKTSGPLGLSCTLNKHVFLGFIHKDSSDHRMNNEYEAVGIRIDREKVK